MLLRRLTNGPGIRAGLGVGILVLFFAVPPLSVRGASSIAQGFQTDDANVVAGALVSLKSNTPNAVELSTADQVDRIVGVAGKDSVIELSHGTGAVQVVTSGETPALVSNINGEVKAGDKITASPIAGVGMKAVTSTLVIGTAQDNLGNASTESRTVADKKGKQKSVQIGIIPVLVDKVFYEAPQDANSFLPPVLQDFASSVAGHQVSPVRIMISGFLIILLFVAVTILLYSAVRSSIISIGRNPLSEQAVHKSLFQVGLTILGLLVFTALVVYLILTT
jgi:hypothetical protein